MSPEAGTNEDRSAAAAPLIALKAPDDVHNVSPLPGYPLSASSAARLGLWK